MSEMIEFFFIGYAGEKNARRKPIDISDLLTRWPDATPTLMVNRPKEEAPYPAQTTLEGTMLYWEVSDIDVEKSGFGQAQVYMIDKDGDLLGKSEVINTLVKTSLNGTEQEKPPTAIETWVTKFLEAHEEAKDGYVTKDQGTENAGKVLGVGSDGKVTPMAYSGGGDNPGGGANIDDTTPSTTTTYSSSKIDELLNEQKEAIDAKGDPTDEQVSTAVNAYLTENPVAAGWNNTQINLLEQLLDKLAYTDQSVGQTLADALIVSLRNSSSGGESGGGDSGEGGGDSTEVTLKSIQAYYSGGDVVVGTPVNSLSDIVVIANYSDGSTQVVTDYTLNGEIAEGANTVTVSYQGMTATFTVNGVAEVVKTYTITNSLTNITTDNASETVEENSTYVATLTPDEGYNIGTVTVTMGGVDITSSAYSGGVISIANVTGNIIIIAEVVSTLVYSLPEATTFDGTNYVDTSYVLNDVDKDFSILVEFEPAQHGNNTAVFSADKNANKYGPAMIYSAGTDAYRLSVANTSGSSGYLLSSTLKSRAVITHKKGSGTFDFYNIDGRLNFASHAVTEYAQYATNAHTVGNNLPVRLGARAYSEVDFFKGTIHRFEIYETVISSEEIDQFIAATYEESSEPVNLIDMSTLTAGPTTMPDGRAVTADHYLTDFIPIEYGNPYVTNITKYINDTETVSNQYFYVYNSDKTYLGQYSELNSSKAMGTKYDVTWNTISKEATRYVRIVFHKNYLDTAFFGEGRV